MTQHNGNTNGNGVNGKKSNHKEVHMNQTQIKVIIKKKGLDEKGITALKEIAKDLGVPLYTTYNAATADRLRIVIYEFMSRSLLPEEFEDPEGFKNKTTLINILNKEGGDDDLRLIAYKIGMHRSEFRKLEGMELVNSIYEFQLKDVRSKVERNDKLADMNRIIQDMFVAQGRKARRATEALIRGKSDQQILKLAGFKEIEISAFVKQGTVKEQVQLFKDKLEAHNKGDAMKNRKLSLIATKPKEYSGAVNPVSENDPKIRLHGLSPTLEKVKGIVYTGAVIEITETQAGIDEHGDPVQKEVVIGTDFVINGTDAMIEIASNSPFYEWCKGGKVIPMSIEEHDSNNRVKIFKRMQDVAASEAKHVLGNAKKSEPLLGKAYLEDWTELMGDDPRNHDNPFKPTGTFMTPNPYQIASTENAQYLRVRVINDEIVGHTPRTEHMTGWGGHPLNDGNMLTCLSMWYTPVSELKRFAKQMEEYNAAVTAGKEVTVPKPPKEERVNGNAQARSYHVFDEADVKVMAELAVTNPSIYQFKVGDVMPSFKGKCMFHVNRYEEKVEEYGFNLEDQDAIMGLGNFKTQKGRLKHGDIVLIPITPEKPALRIVAIKVSDGKSSLGVQSVRLDSELVSRIVETAIPNAQIVVDALAGKASGYLSILKSDAEATMDDAISEPLKAFLFTKYDEELGDWRVPMYTSRITVMMARIWTYLIQNVYKVRLSDLAFYLEVNEELDLLEYKHFLETNEKVYMFNGPSKKKFTKLLGPDTKWNIGRNPVVGDGNFMEFHHHKLNGTTDCIELSARALWTMFGDVDGDTCIVFPHPDIAFPVTERPLPPVKEKKAKAKGLMSEEAFVTQTYRAYLAIAQSAIDTGSLDNLSRQIIFENWWNGTPLTPAQIMHMGEIVQLAIDGMKHHDISAEEDAAATITRLYGVNGRVMPLRSAPQDYCALRKDGGNSSVKGIPHLCMKAIIRKLQDIKCSEYNPYRHVLNVLRDVSCTTRHSDSTDMRNLCRTEWAKKVALHSEFRQLKAELPWTPQFVLNATSLLINGGNLYGTIIEGYSLHSRILQDDKSLIVDKRARRIAWAALANDYRGYIDIIAEFACKKYFGKPDYRFFMDEFKEQLMLSIGVQSFGTWSGQDRDTGADKITSKPGSLFWLFDADKFIIPLAKRVNPDNPYIKDVEIAVAENIRKRIEREATEYMDRIMAQGEGDL